MLEEQDLLKSPYSLFPIPYSLFPIPYSLIQVSILADSPQKLFVIIIDYMENIYEF